MLTTPWEKYRIHRHVIQPKCKCDQELFRDLNRFLVESVYIPNIDRYHRLIPMATPKMKSCVSKKTGDHEHTKDKKTD